MKRLICWFLFQTRAGDRLLHFVERHLGFGLMPTESIDEAATTLICAVNP